MTLSHRMTISNIPRKSTAHDVAKSLVFTGKIQSAFQFVRLGCRRCTARDFRFLSRRDCKTLRPPLVAIRARNPWVRARLRRLG